MMRIFPMVALAVFGSLGVVCAPPTAGAEPGGSPVCDPNPPDPVFERVVAPCDPVGRALDGSMVPLPGLPWCSVPYEWTPDIAALGGQSWFCRDNGRPDNPDVLPYCAEPLVLVPDARSVEGQRWQCPVAVGSGPAPPPPDVRGEKEIPPPPPADPPDLPIELPIDIPAAPPPSPPPGSFGPPFPSPPGG